MAPGVCVCVCCEGVDECICGTCNHMAPGMFTHTLYPTPLTPQHTARGHFSEQDAAAVVRVVLEVVRACHEAKILHRYV